TAVIKWSADDDLLLIGMNESLDISESIYDHDI
ncbi:unnamed protein product, partial [Cylindrotheca closterium]